MGKQNRIVLSFYSILCIKYHPLGWLVAIKKNKYFIILKIALNMVLYFSWAKKNIKSLKSDWLIGPNADNEQKTMYNLFILYLDKIFIL